MSRARLRGAAPACLVFGLLAGPALAQTKPTSSLDCPRKATAEERLACYVQAYDGIVECTGAALADRLACYDGVAQYQWPEGSGKVPTRTMLGWKIRDKIGIDAIGDYAIEKTGAKLELGRNDGDNFSTTKVAALYLGRAINAAGWTPFGGVGWKRDTSDPSKRSDVRELSGGLTGAINSKPGGFAVYPTAQLTGRWKLYTQTREAIATLNGDVFVPSWHRSDKTLAWSVVPVIGFAASSVDDNVATTSDGAYLGAYAGVRFDYTPKAVFPRLTVAGKIRAYRDAKAPSGADKRKVERGSMTLSYDLADPETKTGVVPSIALTLERGLDPIAGEGPARKRTLALTVRYN